MSSPFMAIMHTTIIIMEIIEMATTCREIYNGQRTCGYDELTETERNKKKNN